MRFDNLSNWTSNPHRLFHADVPILIEVDGYYYLGLTRDLLEGNYDAIDENRAAPEGRPRPQPVPLLVWVTYLTSKLTSYPLEWIAMIMSAVLGLLLAFPMYALGKCYGGTAFGLSAAFVALISRYFMRRSSVGWYDTDALNVPLVMALCFFFLQFARTLGRERYYYLGGGVAVFGVLLWWWHTAPAVVVVFGAVPLAVAFLFYYRPSRNEGIMVYGLLACIALPALLWKGRSFVAVIRHLYAGLFEISTSAFPLSEGRTAEQIGVSFAQQVEWSIGSLSGFVAAGVGLGVLVWRQRLDCLFIVVPLVAGLTSFQAKRYMIWFAPIVGLGIGAIVNELWRSRRRHWALGLLAPAFLIAVWWPNIGKMQEDNRFGPTRSPYHFEAMKLLAETTPANAIVWANWGHGYPLIFYSGRGVVADGGAHSGMHLYAGSVPLAANDFRLAANWMQFYDAHGMDGLWEMYRLFGEDWVQGMRALKEILAAGPEQATQLLTESPVFSYGDADRWLPFFFPQQSRPAYLFLDLAKISTGWFQYGTWDFETRQVQRNFFGAFLNVRIKGETITNGSTLSIDLSKGIARLRNQRYALKELVVIRRGTRPNDIARRRWTYESKDGRIFWLIDGVGFGALMDEQTANTTLVKLFCGLEENPRYFRAVKTRLPLYQIWEVNGDRIERDG